MNIEGDEPSVYSYRTIIDEDTNTRLPEIFESVGQKKVAIIGCGSIGSKVAVQLLRAKVDSFLLIDDDIFFEGNLERNELSVSGVGFHKTEALSSRLKSIEPKISVEVRQIRLGGQESSATTVSAMEQISSCDLIIDATADDRAFNILASVSKSNKIPMAWGSVFAGGIGGLVGRVRPYLDPVPLDAKQQIKQWCDSQEHQTPSTSNDNIPYGLLNEDGTPEIATDSDVSLIAAHVSRLAMDTLLSPDLSSFPYSAYAIGMAKGWIFFRPLRRSTPFRIWGCLIGKAKQKQLVNGIF